MRRAPGFALIAALFALWVLSAVGILVFIMTTQDVRISSRSVGEKRAFYATEAGIHTLVRNFDPLNPANSATANAAVDVTDSQSKYSITAPTVPAKGPASVPIPGHSIGGGQSMAASRYASTVTGKNTNYGTTVAVDVGIGFGPVDPTTTQR